MASIDKTLRQTPRASDNGERINNEAPLTQWRL